MVRRLTIVFRHDGLLGDDTKLDLDIDDPDTFCADIDVHETGIDGLRGISSDRRLLPFVSPCRIDRIERSVQRILARPSCTDSGTDNKESRRKLRGKDRVR
jgi:hypothetical protein